MVKVALVRYMPREEAVLVNGKNYAFSVRRGISLCSVDEEDVPAVLAISKICCGGQRKKIFKEANQAQIDIWSL